MSRIAAEAVIRLVFITTKTSSSLISDQTKAPGDTHNMQLRRLYSSKFP